MAKKRPRPYDPLAPLPPQRIRRIAARQAATAYQPLRAQYVRLRSELDAETAREQQRAAAAAQGLAELLRSVGPATGEAYQQAAGTVGALGKGFSSALAAQQQAQAQAAADFLHQIVGAPQGQIEQVRQIGASGPDVTYALGGAIPGGALAREGAAFASAANLLPATALGRGQQTVQMLIMDALKRRRELAGRQAEALAGLPGLQSDLEQKLLDRELQKEALRTNKYLAGVTGKTAEAEAAAAEAAADREERRLALDKLKNDQDLKLRLRELGIQEKNLKLQIAILEGQQASASADQQSKWEQDAGASAEDAYYGIAASYDDEGKVTAWRVRPMSYKAALRRMVLAGIPLFYVERALNAYYKRGQRGRPMITPGERRTARRTGQAEAPRGRR
ncbi:MAG: hypothetical protein HY323_05545 [Betaproteobacteria bacterium]|nr:hypothetical protein [Betaproteobacteria bacterium]